MKNIRYSWYSWHKWWQFKRETFWITNEKKNRKRLQKTFLNATKKETFELCEGVESVDARRPQKSVQRRLSGVSFDGRETKGRVTAWTTPPGKENTGSHLKKSEWLENNDWINDGIRCRKQNEEQSRGAGPKSAALAFHIYRGKGSNGLDLERKNWSDKCWDAFVEILVIFSDQFLHRKFCASLFALLLYCRHKDCTGYNK